MDHDEGNTRSGAAAEVALLGRRDGVYLEVLAYNADEGKVLCLFDTQELARVFSRINPEIRGQGWGVYVMTADRLPDLVEDFDYVTMNPSPQLNSKKELIDARGFARSLKHRYA